MAQTQRYVPQGRLTSINQYRAYREQKERLRRRRNLRFSMVLCLVFWLACLVGGYFFALSSFFAVSQIKISGNATISDDRLRELSGIDIGQNIFAVDMQKVEDWLKIDYMVKEAKVSRQLPATLKIDITERTSCAIVVAGSSFAIVDSQGMVIKRLREISEADLIYISGVDGVQGGLMPGEKLDNEQMTTAIEVIQQIPQLVAESSGIGELDVQDPQKIKLYTKAGVEIRIGSSANFDEKQIVYTNIINDLEKNKKLDNIRYIDVSLPDRPVYFFDN